MTKLKRTLSIFLRVLLPGALILLAACTVAPDAGSGDGTAEPSLPQPKTLTDPIEIELNEIIQEAAAGREDVLAFMLFRVVIDHVDYSEADRLALVWIALVDKQTGLVQSSETGLVIAHQTTDPATPWIITFQADPSFAQVLMTVPEKMLSAEVREHYMPAIQQEPKAPVVYRGYHLPWTNGESVRLTGSIGHVFTYKSCPSTCLYAFDFANGTMFPIRAARRGTVKYAVWQYPNGNTTNANYIILEDKSTSPTTYQVYFHLAQNSIPANLRVIGAEVVQGQFIGNVDDTGYSSGNHLHFHVHTNPASYWGTSVDIVFDEVAINGGRPRLCSEAEAYPEYGTQCVSDNRYISRNSDAEPPTGGITSPSAYTTITSPILNVSGWMKDDVKVWKGQLYYTTGKDWTPIGEEITSSPFTQDIDMCAADIPDGTFFLQIKVQDEAGKTSEGTQGLTELTKTYNCPAKPPVCTPADNQVAIHSARGFQGVCSLLDIGNYPNLAVLEPNFLDNVISLQVGAGVSAVLFPDTDFRGLLELFQDGDADLSDNLIGAGNAGSIKVLPRITPPIPPTLILPEVITEVTELQLQWTAGEGEETRSELTGPDNYTNSLDWQTGKNWQVGTLPVGTYTWTVTARNLAGTTSATQEFDVTAKMDAPSSRMDELPLAISSSVVKLTWQVLSGADGLDHFNIQYRLQGKDWQELPEEPGKDAREMLFWGQPGSTVEFRLQAVDILGNAEEFNTIPEAFTTFVAPCSEDGFEGIDAGDDQVDGASLIESGVKQVHNWCPAGDVDWVVFNALMGDQMRFTTKALDLASAANLQLYKTDGSLLGEVKPQNASADGVLEWTVPEDGLFALKLTPVDGRIAGTDTEYELNLEKKSTVEPGTLICGSAAIPVLLGGGYLAAKRAKKVQKQKKRAKNMGW